MIIDHRVELLLSLELKHDPLSLAVIESRSLLVACLWLTKIHRLRIILPLKGSWVEHWLRLGVGLILHTTHHVSDHSAHRGLENLERKIDNVLWYPGAQQERGALVREVVAIILEQIIGLHTEFGIDVHQEFKEDVFRKFCGSERNFIDGGPIRGHACRAVADAASKIIFLRVK